MGDSTSTDLASAAFSHHTATDICGSWAMGSSSAYFASCDRNLTMPRRGMHDPESNLRLRDAEPAVWLSPEKWHPLTAVILDTRLIEDRQRVIWAAVLKRQQRLAVAVTKRLTRLKHLANAATHLLGLQAI